MYIYKDHILFNDGSQYWFNGKSYKGQQEVYKAIDEYEAGIIESLRR